MSEREAKVLGGAGTLTDEDIEELKGGVRRVALLMHDGLWHSAEEVRLAAGTNGVPASEGLRRLRSLRARFGIEVEKRRVGEGRGFEYRVVENIPPDTPVQSELFCDTRPQGYGEH